MGELSYDPEYSDVLNDAYGSTVISVGTVAVEARVGAQTMAKRETLLIANKGPDVIYFGPPGVTPSSGMPLPCGKAVKLNFGDCNPVFLITATGTSNVIVQEVA